MKKCSKCGKKKALDQFNKNSHRKDNLQSFCRLCGSKLRAIYWEKNKKNFRKYNNRSRKAKKKWYVEYKGTLECCTCGEDRHYTLDFHHKDPSKKEYSIGEMLGNFGRERIMEEIKKCAVVCANCHRSLHYKH